MSDLAQSITDKINNKTKPLGSLGQLETLAQQIALVQKTDTPVLSKPHIFVFAADHGLADAGVSAFPKAVTAQMVENFTHGGAAINVFCRQHFIGLSVIDVGVDADFPDDMSIIHAKVAKGTKNALEEEAMSNEELAQCFFRARSLIKAQVEAGSNVFGFGEMGIGNTASAALIMHAVTRLPLEDCVGRGTGLDDAGLAKKLEILTQVAKKHQLDQLLEPRDILRAVGGFEIAHMAASMLAAESHGAIILVDGFIATAAYAIAYRMKPKISTNTIFCHTSAERGHELLLQYLDAKPILNLGLRLGEGTGCALACPLLRSAVNFLNEMASFADAGVDEQIT